MPPPPLLLWAGGGVRGWGQAEVTQVALLRFRLLGCERDRDPDQTRPDQTGRDHMAALKAFNGAPSNRPGKKGELNKTSDVMTASVCFCSHHLRTHTWNRTAGLHQNFIQERERAKKSPAVI